MFLPKPKEVLLMGPGPSPVSRDVLSAIGQHTLGHLDADFLDIMNETSSLLRYVFETENEITFPVSGTGSAGMEAAMVNLLEPGDEVIIAVCGVFGQRMVDVASRCGAKVNVVEADWGQPIDPQRVARAVTDNPCSKMIGIVHAETSTGVLQDLKPIKELIEGKDMLLLVDAVTSLGGIPVEVDKLGLDIVYSGNQKCLGAPPGLAPITFNDKALDAVQKRKSKVQSWYLDLTFLTRYWGEERFYHHTAPINMIYGLYEALAEIREEGLVARFTRHSLHSKALVAGLEALGVRPVVDEKDRLASLTAVWIPDGVDDVAVRSGLRRDHLIEIGGGLGPFKGKVWRIGIMGHGARRENVERLVNALAVTLKSLQYSCSLSEAEAAVNSVYKNYAGQ